MIKANRTVNMLKVQGSRRLNPDKEEVKDAINRNVEKS